MIRSSSCPPWRLDGVAGPTGRHDDAAAVTPRQGTRSRFRTPANICERGHGAQGRNRTTDTVIFSHVLYQLSYLGAGPFQDGHEERGAL